MNGWGYLIQTVAVGAGSFLLGYLAGRTARDVHRIAETVTDQGETVPKRMPFRARIGASGAQLAVAVVVVVLAVVTLVQGFVNSAANRRILTCSEAYANALADAIDARSQGSAQAQEALDQLMTTFGRLAASPPVDGADLARRTEESRKALTDYVAKRAEVKALQQENPYPQPPRESCPR